MRYGSLPRDEGVGGIVGAVLGVLGGGGAIGFLLLIVLLAAARNRRTWGGGNSRWSNYPPNHPYWNNNQQGTVPEGFQQSSVLSGISGATQDPVDSGGSMTGTDSGMRRSDSGGFRGGGGFGWPE